MGVINHHRHGYFKGNKVIDFKFTESVLENEIEEAVLNINLEELEGKNNTAGDPDEPISVTLLVDRVTKFGQRKASVQYTNNSVKLARSVLKKGKWLKLDITSMVDDHFRLSRNDLAVLVRAQDSNNRLNLVVNTSKVLMPFVQVSIKDNTHTRTRRTLGMDCTEALGEERCCRYPLDVNFEDFGWDWIIAPKNYSANYCKGECTFSYLQKYSHTHLVDLALPQGSGRPCCGPRRMSSISMLYFDNDLNILLTTIPGMVVESCGCS